MVANETHAIERRLEEAAMNAWPALQVCLLDGWVVRFAGGYTKRANSVNPTYPSTETDLLAKVETCEALFARQGLPCIFRLTSFGAPAGLDKLLIDRGYAPGDLSLVLTRRLDHPPLSTEKGTRLQLLPVEEWLDWYVSLSGATLGRRDAHLAILKHIPGETLFATILPAGADRPVACGLAVVEGTHVGLFDIVTDRAHRNQGHGSALVEALLTRAAGHGATSAYLQVVADNAAAIALYRKLGFEEAYRYWYRISSK